MAPAEKKDMKTDTTKGDSRMPPVSAPALKMPPVQIGGDEAKVLNSVWQWHEQSANTKVVLGCPLPLPEP